MSLFQLLSDHATHTTATEPVAGLSAAEGSTPYDILLYLPLNFNCSLKITVSLWLALVHFLERMTSVEKYPYTMSRQFSLTCRLMTHSCPLPPSPR